MFVSVCGHTCPSICLKKRKEEKNNKDTEYERSEYFVQRNGGHPLKLAEIKCVIAYRQQQQPHHHQYYTYHTAAATSTTT